MNKLVCIIGLCFFSFVSKAELANCRIFTVNKVVHIIGDAINLAECLGDQNILIKGRNVSISANSIDLNSDLSVNKLVVNADESIVFNQHSMKFNELYIKSKIVDFSKIDFVNEIGKVHNNDLFNCCITNKQLSLKINVKANKIKLPNTWESKLPSFWGEKSKENEARHWIILNSNLKNKADTDFKTEVSINTDNVVYVSVDKNSKTRECIQVEINPLKRKSTLKLRLDQQVTWPELSDEIYFVDLNLKAKLLLRNLILNCKAPNSEK